MIEFLSAAKRLARAATSAVVWALVPVTLISVTTTLGVATALAGSQPESKSPSSEATTATATTGPATGISPNLLPRECATDPDCNPFPPDPPFCYPIQLEQPVPPPRGFNPEFGGPYSHVSWTSGIECRNGPFVSSMRTELWDRTTNQLLTTAGSDLTTAWKARSSEAIDLYNDLKYPDAQRAEVLLVADLAAGTSRRWNPCGPAQPGWYLIECSGAGTATLHVVVGFFPFDTGVTTPPCTTRSWEWAPRQPVGVLGRQNYVLATPTALFQYCVTNYGNVREGSATLIQFQAGTRYPGLVADPTTVSIVKFIDNGRTAYRVSFPLTFRFNQEVQIEAGIGPADAGITFKGNDTCSLSVGFTLGNGNPQDTDTPSTPAQTEGRKFSRSGAFAHFTRNSAWPARSPQPCGPGVSGAPGALFRTRTLFRTLIPTFGKSPVR